MRASKKKQEKKEDRSPLTPKFYMTKWMGAGRGVGRYTMGPRDPQAVKKQRSPKSFLSSSRYVPYHREMNLTNAKRTGVRKTFIL